MPLAIPRNPVEPLFVRLARSVFAGLLSAALLFPASGSDAQDSPATAEVFRRNADRVVKIQVIESGSAAKATIGSGFFVTDRGHIVTNYHVVSDIVHDPDRYRAEFVDAKGERHPVAVVEVDVVHDLALLVGAYQTRPHFTLAAMDVAQGNRLFALGHPADLGLSIVEGTYNGHLSHTLHPRIHFTGSLNSGMSGGPTITGDGRVIGINVATSGNQISFLVPVERAVALVERALSPTVAPGGASLEHVASQLRAYQDTYLQDMFATETETVELGPFRVVTEPAPFFRCWADATRREDLMYEQVHHRCSTDDYLFIAGDHSSGVVEVEHMLISTKKLGPTRFFALYSNLFGMDETPGGREEHVTSWKCSTRNVRNDHLPMRAVLCLRRYRKLGELYDGVLKVAALGRREFGLVSTLTLSGVSFENVDKLSRRYMELISWR